MGNLMFDVGPETGGSEKKDNKGGGGCSPLRDK